jgi:hypothetical protein
MLKKRYLVIFVLAFGVLLSSCFKVEPTVAAITVINEQGTFVPGAEVRLFNLGRPGNEPKFDTIQFTNGSGIASFDFSECYEAGQSGFAVLNVSVTKGTLTGSGIINIEEQVTTSETYVIE